MKTTCEASSLQEQLKEQLKAENRRHKDAVKWINLKFLFRGGDAKEQLKILAKTSSVNSRGQLWGYLSVERRMDIAKLHFSKAHNLKVHVQEYSGLDLSRMRVTPTRYMLMIYLFPGCSIEYSREMLSRPSDEQVLASVRTIMPWIKVVQTDKPKVK